MKRMIPVGDDKQGRTLKCSRCGGRMWPTNGERICEKCGYNPNGKQERKLIPILYRKQDGEYIEVDREEFGPVKQERDCTRDEKAQMCDEYHPCKLHECTQNQCFCSDRFRQPKEKQDGFDPIKTVGLKCSLPGDWKLSTQGKKKSAEKQKEGLPPMSHHKQERSCTTPVRCKHFGHCDWAHHCIVLTPTKDDPDHADYILWQPKEKVK